MGAIVACLSLYICNVIACWRMSSFFCMRWKFILLLPVLNLVYFAALADTVAIESHESKESYLKFGMCVLVPILISGIFLSQIKQYEILMLAGRIVSGLSVIYGILVLAWCYMIIIENSFNHPLIVEVASFIIPAPVFLLIASFTIQEKTQEVVKLYF